MKEQFKLFLTNELQSKEAILLNNTINPEDKELLTKQVENLKEMIEKVDTMEEVDTTIVDELKATVAAMSESLIAINEKLNQNQKETKEEDMIENAYLNTKQALVDFYNSCKNATDAKTARANWEANLLKNDIVTTEGEALLPAAISGAIMDAWERPGNWLKDLKNTGLKSYKIRTVVTGGDEEEARAKGHKRGESKTSQELEVLETVLNLQAIYKLMELPRIDIVNDDNGELVKYLADEIYRQIIVEVQKAILCGDGRSSGNPDYRITSLTSLVTSADNDTTYVSSYTSVNETNEATLADFMQAGTLVNNVNNDKVYAVMSKQQLVALQSVSFGEGTTTQFVSKEVIAETLGVDEIITTAMLPDYVTGIIFIPRGYVTIGNLTNVDYMKGFEYKTNTEVFLGEIFVGGAPEMPKMGVVINSTSEQV